MLGIVFPGQGSQKVGMAKYFVEKHKEIFDCINEVSKKDIKKIILSGTEEELALTNVAQPAILGASCCILQEFKTRNISFSAFAGHSVGEYVAFFAANGCSLQSVTDMLFHRAKYMTEAGQEASGTMAGFISVSNMDSAVNAVKQHNCYIACMNSPEHLAISGTTENINRLIEFCANNKVARRVIKLKVAGAFHCSLMNSAYEKFAEYVDDFEILNSFENIFCNFTGEIADKNFIKTALTKQLVETVQWVKCMQNMAKETKLIVEAGSGGLSKFASSIDNKINIMSCANEEDMNKIQSIIENIK